MAKLKTCSFCQKEVHKLWYSKPPCCGDWQCKKKYNESKTPKQSNDTTSPAIVPRNSNTRSSSIKNKTRKPTGELKLFLRIYSTRNGRCQITSEQIPFNVSSFAHILPKGAYPGYRLNPNNIIMVKTRIHELYDTSSKEKLLSEFPEASVIYEIKDKLRYEYYNGSQREHTETDQEDTQ